MTSSDSPQGKYETALPYLERAVAIYQAPQGSVRAESKAAMEAATDTLPWLRQAVAQSRAAHAGVPRKRYDILPIGTSVIVQHLQSKPEFNDRIGRVRGFDDTHQRYKIELLDGGGIIAPKPQNVLQMVESVRDGDDDRLQAGTIVGSRRDSDRPRFALRLSGGDGRNVTRFTSKQLHLPKGTLVTISGLKARPELNGSRATIESWNSVSKRYVVHLSADKKIMVRRDNFTIAC